MINRILRQILFSVFIFAPCVSDAYSPKKEALGGSVRSGIPVEGLFTNHASMAGLTGSTIFGYYSKTKIRDFNDSGRAFAVGVYDGTNTVKGGLAFIREGRPHLYGSTPVYRDRAKIRSGVGMQLWSALQAGLLTDYTIQYLNSKATDKFFNVSVGFAYQVFRDLRFGVLYENLREKAGEEPPNVGAGLRYDVAGPLVAYGDWVYVVAGSEKKKKSWNLGLEFLVVSDLVIRGGIFSSQLTSHRGYSAGLGWQAARSSIEYAYRTTTHSPIEREHTLALTVQM